MLIQWLLLGLLLAALIRTFIEASWLQTYFGPTLLGLGATMLGAFILEVCSEGSTPIAAEIFNQAKAPGNAFAFLMGGVATDVTEMMILRQATGTWRIPLFLPLLSLPQITVLAVILNLASV